MKYQDSFLWKIKMKKQPTAVVVGKNIVTDDFLSFLLLFVENKSCHVAGIKYLPVIHQSTDIIFISFGLTDARGIMLFHHWTCLLDQVPMYYENISRGIGVMGYRNFNLHIRRHLIQKLCNTSTWHLLIFYYEPSKYTQAMTEDSHKMSRHIFYEKQEGHDGPVTLTWVS